MAGKSGICGCRNKNTKTSRSAVALLLAFCSNTRANYTDYAPQLIRGLIQLLVSPDDQTLHNAWDALSAVTKVRSRKVLRYKGG